jgi:hypothetical protein
MFVLCREAFIFNVLVEIQCFTDLFATESRSDLSDDFRHKNETYYLE